MKYLVNRETKEHKIYRFPDYVPPLWDLVDADPEGWIKHDGDVNPLPYGCECETILMTMTRGMSGSPAKSELWDWASGQTYSIYKYRPILDDKPEMVKCKVGNRPDYYKPHPDDIISRLKSAHKAASELPDIIAELREVLEPMGYDLVARSPFVEVEPEPDPSKWAKGDLIECLVGHRKDLTKGKLYEVIESDGVTVTINDDKDPRECRDADAFRFHSRPTKEQTT